MTKGKKWTLRLLGVAALALLICLCLLGSTMARYTSTGDGSGTLTVALWDLETTTVNIGADDETVKISPSDDPYYDDTGAAQERTNDCGAVKALSMVNNSAVAAKVTLELATPDETDATSTGLSSGLTLTEAEDFTWGTGYSGDEGTYGTEESPKGKAQTNKYGQELMNHFGAGTEGEAKFLAVVNAYGVIALTLTSDEAGTTPISAEEPIYLNAYGDTTTNDRTYKQDVYADVVWTSIYEGNTQENMTPSDFGFYTDETNTTGDWEAFSDAVDSILGMYYEGISFSVTWTAVQDSVQPVKG